ncbi:unnamed protein product [Ectocarpus sp. 8 AP-2014]
MHRRSAPAAWSATSAAGPGTPAPGCRSPVTTPPRKPTDCPWTTLPNRRRRTTQAVLNWKFCYIFANPAT